MIFNLGRARKYTISLTHFDGSNGAFLPFTDEVSGLPPWYIATSGPRLNTSIKKFGSASLYFYDDGDYSSYVARQCYSTATGTTVTNNQYIFGSRPFTIDFQMYAPSYSGWVNYMFSFGYLGTPDDPDAYKIELGQSSAGNLGGYIGGGYFIGSNPLNINAWNHVEIVGNTSSIMFFTNGVKKYTRTINYNIGYASGYSFGKGMMFEGDTQPIWPGYIDELRFSKGIARHVADFTPPAAAYVLD